MEEAVKLRRGGGEDEVGKAGGGRRGAEEPIRARRGDATESDEAGMAEGGVAEGVGWDDDMEVVAGSEAQRVEVQEGEARGDDMAVVEMRRGGKRRSLEVETYVEHEPMGRGVLRTCRRKNMIGSDDEVACQHGHGRYMRVARTHADEVLRERDK